MISIRKELHFLSRKKKLIELKRKITFASMSFVMKMYSPFPFTLQIKNLKIQWICCLYLMEINHIICASKILTDLCFTKQKIKIKITFGKLVYSVLAVNVY